jgi:hypothetical protein
MKKIVNGILMDMTAEEISAKEAKTKEWNDEAPQREAIENDRASGKQKLKDLGLTDAEIKALTGA